MALSDRTAPNKDSVNETALDGSAGTAAAKMLKEVQDTPASTPTSTKTEDRAAMADMTGGDFQLVDQEGCPQ